MTTPRPEKLPPGIRREAGRTGYIVEVRVRPFPKRRLRFDDDTPIAAMVAWRNAQIAEFIEDRRKLNSEMAAATDPLAPSQRFRMPGGTLRADVEAYLENRIRPTLHPDTRLQFARWLRKAAQTELGRCPRQVITGATWATLLAQWERNGIPASREDGGRHRIVPPGPLASDTVNKIRTCWIGFYDAMNVGTKLANPARLVPRRDPAKPQARGIPWVQAVAIIDAVSPGTRTAARLALMCLLGLRPVEIMRIKPAVDWNKAERTLAVRTAKGGKHRTLALSDRAVAALELLERLQGWGQFSSAPAARMFHTAVNKAKLAHLEPLRPYDLRHCFGTEAYRKTGDLKAVAEAMGHRNLSQTERYVEGAVSEKVASVCTAIAASTPAPRLIKRKRGKLREVK